MSSSGRRVSLNKGYTVRGFADKVFHLHLRYRNDKDEVYFRHFAEVIRVAFSHLLLLTLK